MFRADCFWIRVWGCLYLAYWAALFRNRGRPDHHFLPAEHKHHPAVKTASHELHYDQKIAKTWKGNE